MAKTHEIVNITKESKKENYVCDTWNFLVGKGSKQVQVCVHLDMDEMPKQEMIIKHLVKYLYAFEDIRKTGTYNIKERSI